MFRLILICLVVSAIYAEITIKTEATRSTMYSEINIAFGSNFYPNSTAKNNVFEKILKTKPDVFLWVGETLVDRSRGKHYGQQLMKLKDREDYSDFIEHVKVTGVEDLTHVSSGVRAKYLTFLDEDPSSPRWNSLELYQALWIESHPTSSHESVKPKRVKVLMLDVNMADLTSDEISPNQFAWLEEELKEEEDDHFMTIITSGYQVLPDDKMYELDLDMEAKIKLLELIKKSPVPVLILSGASLYSFGEVMRFPCSVEEDLGYNLYEVTSAGLNWHEHEHIEIYNKFTVGPTFSGLKERVYEPNFGHVKIVYNHMTQSPEISIELINEEGEKLVSIQPDFTKVKERKKFNRDVLDDLSLCSKKLYASNSPLISIAKSAVSNLPHLLADPGMRIYIMAAASFLLCLFVAFLFCGVKLMNNAKRMDGGGSYSWGGSMRGLDEYERYHMD